VSDLFTPGDHRAGELMSDRALVAAMIRVECAWYAVLADTGIAPTAKLPPVALTDLERAELAEAAEAGGNPVIPLVALLRERVGEVAARWLHRGLTSQDVVDTALMLMFRDMLDVLVGELCQQIGALQKLANEHRDSVCAGRTLTQHAVPTTFGRIAAGWLDGLVAVASELAAILEELPIQLGGAAGTLSAIDLIAPGRAVELSDDLADRLGLQRSVPWHTQRRPITRIVDVLVAAGDGWGGIANDVLVRSRPEIAELSEGSAPGRGGSSTMPHKQNPVLSVLIRRSALNAPFLGAAVHAAAGATIDQRPDGGWHAEWAPIRTLARQSVAAASQMTELLCHLRVDSTAMAANAKASRGDLLAEARSMAKLTGTEPPSGLTDYLGANDQLIDAALSRAAAVTTELRR
jgi:3-carboxy-cis,cis-muconate cycloisomerase